LQRREGLEDQLLRESEETARALEAADKAAAAAVAALLRSDELPEIDVSTKCHITINVLLK
jgi:hypothetical protein